MNDGNRTKNQSAPTTTIARPPEDKFTYQRYGESGQDWIFKGGVFNRKDIGAVALQLSEIY